jgi:hypothetical protein
MASALTTHPLADFEPRIVPVAQWGGTPGASHKDYSAQTVCPGANLYRYLENGYFRERVALRLKQR